MKSGILCLSLGMLLITGCAASAEDTTPAMDTDEQKALYAVGFTMSKNLQNLELTPEELALVQAGMRDGVLGNEEKIDTRALLPRLQEIFDGRIKAKIEKDREAGLKVCEAAKAEEGVTVLSSGAVYRETQAGDGAQPAATDKVKINYKGTFYNGTVFDRSPEGKPAEFYMNKVIPCLQEGVARMKVGGKATLTCPPDSAYGDSGTPGILPGSTLIFDVELLGIEPAEAAAAPPATPTPETSPSK